MKELNTIEDINQFFNEANAFTKAQIYGMAYQQSLIREKENLLRKRYEKDDYYKVEEYFIINDDYQIVQIKSKSDNFTKNIYDVFVNYKPINETTEQFATALLSAICYKQTHTTYASIYMAKLIDLPLR